MRLFIVESPAKCQKIRGYLGDGWKVIASMGHVRGLEESLDALGITGGWNPRFEILKGKTKAVKEIKDAAKGAEEVWLGTDDDREGEAIAWHLCHLLKLSPETTPRAIFHEVTETAIQASVADKNKRLNGPMVQAQMARCMLDLLIGFSISPVVSRNIGPGLSAGRCQTPALHLVYDKEQEINEFASKQSWVYEATFTPADTEVEIPCTGTWFPTSLEEARLFLSGAPAGGKLVDVTEKTINQSPPLPLITSSLQQECSSLYHINPKNTMQIAQRLYEAGHITYMRTDNPVLGADCLAECRDYVEGTYGPTYLWSPTGSTGSTGTTGAKAKKKKAKEKEAVVQGAHEAIHPTHMNLLSLPSEEVWSDYDRKVYTHIWRRTLQSIMAPAQQKSRALTFQLDGDTAEHRWKGTLSTLVFKGWKILNTEHEDDERFAKTDNLKVGTKTTWSDMIGRQVATQPPSRFSEAQLVQQLEEKGIGRPSTFASLINTILERKYVEKKTSKGSPVDLYRLERQPGKAKVKESTVKKEVGGDKDKIHLTSLGKSVIEFLDSKFADIFEYGFTAGMEQDLDLVAHGQKERVMILDGMWSTMKERIEESKASTEGGTGANPKALRSFTLEDGSEISIANTKKGVLLIKKKPGVEKVEFAAMPVNKSATGITEEEAIGLFEAKEGESLGDLDGFPVLLKKGQYGAYVEWNGVRHTYKETEFEALCEQLKNKGTGTQDTDSSLGTFCRKVGDYTIKRGQYGLFFYRGGAAKMVFAKFPAGLAAETIGVADCAAAYKMAVDSKSTSSRGGRGGRGGRGRGRGGKSS
jgi:DNA topoisomerase-1